MWAGIKSLLVPILRSGTEVGIEKRSILFLVLSFILRNLCNDFASLFLSLETNIGHPRGHGGGFLASNPSEIGRGGAAFRCPHSFTACRVHFGGEMADMKTEWRGDHTICP